MSLNGIWKLEMLGLYGWEQVATSFLSNGKYMSGSENHYGIGTYEVSGNKIDISTMSVQHGKVRTIFGKNERQMEIKMSGVIEGDEIKGEARDNEDAHHISIRATRLADLP